MILIVDDNQENIFSLKSLLTIHKFEVDTASSGEEALKKILKNSYALIILDVQMPDMDGFEVAEAISGYSKSKDIPIIFLSAVNTHKKFVTKGYTSGGIDYVTKPFDPDILLLKIKTFYKLSEQTRQLNAMEKSLREEIELRKQAENVLEKRVEDRTSDLKKANQRLEESNRELQQFAFIASHDLQEPLRKIETFSNLATDKYFRDEEKLRIYLQKITNSATRLRTLITDLLDYSRIYIDNRFMRADLNAILRDVMTDLDLSESNCKINVSGLMEIDAIPSQISQVFHNLIGNSLKFSRQGIPCVIEISGERVSHRSLSSKTDNTGKFFRLIVKDNGIGFSNEFNERVFEIFQRLNSKNEYEGTGIGLSIVKKVIEKHDGLISASGEENSGASFTIVIPVRHKTF
jgi:light-regulated signal transduction histidine kinase (bacteriophytochrome)